VAKKILANHGIEVFAYVKEAAGVACPDVEHATIKAKTAAFKEVRRLHDPLYDYVFAQKRITPDMRFLAKMAVLAEVEEKLIEIREGMKRLDKEQVRKEYGVHTSLNCPDLDAADEMYEKILEITRGGDSSGGLVEVIATGCPAGMGEPIFRKLDGELGRMMSIAAVKCVEIGEGHHVKDLTGSQNNDQMYGENGQVGYSSNHAGGIAGGMTTGQSIVVRLAVKPTPTIAKDQQTVDKVTKETKALSAVTRRDPTIIQRAWPVAEAFTAIILLDAYVQHLGYQALWRKDVQ
jgi:chorismate synthase